MGGGGFWAEQQHPRHVFQSGTEAIAVLARRQDTVQEDMLGGCVLCEEKNFQREGFSDLTVILCDQCEREFHVGCLRQHMGINLEGLPEGYPPPPLPPSPCGRTSLRVPSNMSCNSSTLF